MPRPETPFYALEELAGRWPFTTMDLGRYAIAGTLTLAIVVVDEVIVVPVKASAGKSALHPRMVQGVVPVLGLDVWRAIKGETVILKQVLDKNGKTVLAIQSEEQYQTVRASDLVVNAEEVRRFAAAHGLTITGDEPPTKAGGSPRKSGAPVVLAWTGYWISTCVRIYQHGIPETNAELVREGLEWFATNSERIPDVRYVERTVQQLMTALRAC